MEKMRGENGRGTRPNLSREKAGGSNSRNPEGKPGEDEPEVPTTYLSAAVIEKDSQKKTDVGRRV